MAAPLGARRLLGHAEEKARADDCFRQRGARPRLPHRRTGKRMKMSIDDAAARQDSGGPSSVPGRGADRNNRPRRADGTELARDIAGLVDRSTQDLRLAWRQLHRTGPPLGLSRDLMIRALAHQRQERAEGGASPALRRRLQSLAEEFEKGGASFDPGIMPKTGTMLVRQWRGHTHTVLVREDGFEYEGQHYRSLSVIASGSPGRTGRGRGFLA